MSNKDLWIYPNGQSKSIDDMSEDEAKNILRSMVRANAMDNYASNQYIKDTKLIEDLTDLIKQTLGPDVDIRIMNTDDMGQYEQDGLDDIDDMFRKHGANVPRRLN